MRNKGLTASSLALQVGIYTGQMGSPDILMIWAKTALSSLFDRFVKY